MNCLFIAIVFSYNANSRIVGYNGGRASDPVVDINIHNVSILLAKYFNPVRANLVGWWTISLLLWRQKLVCIGQIIIIIYLLLDQFTGFDIIFFFSYRIHIQPFLQMPQGQHVSPEKHLLPMYLFPCGIV